MIDQSPIRMLRKLYKWMYQNLEVRRWTSMCLWIVIMHKIKLLLDQEVAFWSTWTLLFFGCFPRNSIYYWQPWSKVTIALRGLRYQLGMLDIPISELWVQCINTAWYIQTRVSAQKEKQSDCYHAVCLSVVMGESLVGHIPSKGKCYRPNGKKSYIDREEGTWLSTFYIIFMMTTKYQWPVYQGL